MHKIFGLFALLFVSVSVFGESVESEREAVAERLPPQVRTLLRQEMNAILAASQNILDAIVRADDERVAEQAQAIHDSFIMKQSLTEDDRKALKNAVPADFLARDKAFHTLSASLAEAARQEDRDRQKALFSEMIDACTGCHSRYAPNL